MSSEPAVSFRGVSKSYRIDLGAHRSLGRTEHRTFAALTDVSFDVGEGEVVGLIGSNGAGKSTLLKILSRVTFPDTGSVSVRGRVGSLLEVGAGFHPELTGRENVFLNGSILGMGRREITRRFDEIVDFAGIPEFLDTPVKRYSSGMYVRLAFAVASHLSSEVLVVDEVLAVGDGAFQSKCMAKMESLANEEGRTILLVTHNLTPVRRLCDKAVYLRKGQVQVEGDVTRVLERYLEDTGTLVSDSTDGHVELTDRTNIHPPHDLVVQAMTLRDGEGKPSRELLAGQPMSVDLRCADLDKYPSAVLAVRISTVGDGAGVASFVHRVPAEELVQGEATWTLHVPSLDIAPGDYEVDSGVLAGPGGHVLDEVRGAMRCRVAAKDMDQSEWKRMIGDGVAVLPSSWRAREDEVVR